MLRVVMYKTGTFCGQFYNATRFDENNEPSHLYNVSDEVYQELIEGEAAFIVGEVPPWVIAEAEKAARATAEVKERVRKEQEEKSAEQARFREQVEEKIKAEEEAAKAEKELELSRLSKEETLEHEKGGDND